MNTELLIGLPISVGVGAFIGIERERDGKGGFAGVRTFILTSISGSLAALLLQEFGTIVLPSLIFTAIVAFVLVSHIFSAQKGFIGITSEISIALVFFLGFIAMYDKYQIFASMIAVVLTILLNLKSYLHGLITRTEDVEWNDTLKFALVTLFIFPILPEEINLGIFPPGSEYYDLNLFFPREIWLLVILVTGVSFIGYFIIKFLGRSRGSLITGALGGLVSSTAVTADMANFSKEDPNADPRPYVVSTMISHMTSLLKIFIIAMLINSELFILAIPLTLFFTIELVNVIPKLQFKLSGQKYAHIGTPFAIRPALTLAVIFIISTILYKLVLINNFGDIGILITSFFGGFVDIDPVILSLSNFSAVFDISTTTAVNGIVLGYLANLCIKTLISLFSGSPAYARHLLITFSQTITVGIIWFVVSYTLLS